MSLLSDPGKHALEVLRASAFQAAQVCYSSENTRSEIWEHQNKEECGAVDWQPVSHKLLYSLKLSCLLYDHFCVQC